MEQIIIKLEFNDLEVLQVNDKDFTITIKTYLGVHWNEPRIISIGSHKDVETPLDLSFMDHVWLPDLEILHLNPNELADRRDASYLLIIIGNRYLHDSK